MVKIEGYIDGVDDEGARRKLAFKIEAIDMADALNTLSSGYPWGVIHLTSPTQEVGND